MELLAGIVRKISIPLVVLSILGWMLFVIGFGLYNFSDAFEKRQNATMTPTPRTPEPYVLDERELEDHRADIFYFPYWCFIVAGPVLFINMFLHLIIGRWFSGIFTNFLVALYLVVGGGVLYFDGLFIFSQEKDGKLEDNITDEDKKLYLFIEWVGCLASVFFLTVHMTMWPLFSKPKDSSDVA